jgi:Ca2+-binding RTX toxin-like protein
VTVAAISWTVGDTPAAVSNEDLDEVTEGSALTFTASSDVSGATFAWTALRDGGVVAVGDGATFGFTADDDGAYRVELTVRGPDGLVSGITVEEFTAVNVMPAITLTGAAGVALSSPYTLTLGPVIDPGTDNGFLYVVHWGDGASDTVGILGTLQHTYTSPGSMTITADVTDEDGTFPAAGSLVVEVTDDEPPAPTCDVEDATIVGTNKADLLTGTGGDDVIWAGNGKDTLIGLGGDDVLCGGNGIDLLLAGTGNDTAVGENGGDLIFGNDGNDVLRGEGGVDVLDGGDGTDSCLTGEILIACEFS